MSKVNISDSKYPNISFTGRICTGKTYLSEFLINSVGYTPLSFAAPLKDIERYLYAYGALRTTIYILYKYGQIKFSQISILYRILQHADELPYENPKPRLRLQYLGSNIRNYIDDRYWTSLLVKQYKKLSAEDELAHFVIEDARYQNEIALLNDLGFITIKLEVLPSIRLARAKRLYGITNLNDPRLHAESEKSCDDPSNVFKHRLFNGDNDSAVEKLRDIIVDYIMAMDYMEKVINEPN